MQLLVFLVAYPLLWLISRLPFRLLYGLSDGMFLLVYYCFGYRKKVVRSNLELVFPDKPKTEIDRIQKRFYAHMIDMFMEMIKTMGLSNAALHKRFVFENVEVLHQLEAQGKSIMLMFPHYASWEWVISLDAHIASKGYGIYQPIKNKYFDQLIRDIRSKFGTTLITTKVTKDTVKKNRRNGQLSMYGILSDQSPQLKKAVHWCDFMGITVPVHTGAEGLCKTLDLPAVYLKVTKLKRGYYQGTFKVLADSPKDIPNFGITEAFLREVEHSILEAPEYYFWTHKRWKHRDKVPTKYLNP
ncbi:MAG: lysophospholipid acyltransferase family protein [Flavobacteriaceae bacterium]|nr:lysophospholipid acyltransferase family protein [Flavobacteriaceae bacterium]